MTKSSMAPALIPVNYGPVNPIIDSGGGMVLYFPVRRESGEAHNLARTPASTLDYCALLIRVSRKLHPKSEFFIYEVTTDSTGRSLSERLLPNEQVARLLDSSAA